MRYLKPTFTAHPLNYIFALLVFLGSFSWASIAFSMETTYYSVGGHSSLSKSGACSAAATAAGGTNYQVSGTICYAYIGGGWPNVGTITTNSCSPSIPVCNPEPENNCPEYGTVKKVSKLINGTIKDGTFIPRDPNEETTIEIGGGSSVDGCGYAVPVGENIPEGMDTSSEIDCIHQGEGESRVLMCFKHQNMIATGELLAPADGEVNSFVPTEDNDYSEGGSKTLLEDEEDHAQTPETTVTDPDGTQVKTSSTVDTLVKDKGARVLDSESTSVITETNGIQKTVTTTVTEVVFPDGTKEVVTDKKTAYTQTPQTIFNIDKSSGNVSITNVAGSSASTTEKTTDTYDSEGNKTGSKTETSQSGEGEAEEEQQQDQCEVNPDECEEAEFTEAEKGEYDQSGVDQLRAEKEAELRAKMEEVEDQLRDAFEFSLTGNTGDISGHSITWRGQTQAQGNNVVKWFDLINMGNLIMLIAGLVALFIMLRPRSD